MKNTFGNQLILTLFGESHGPAIGAVLDGLPAGLTVDEERIRHQLYLRRPQEIISTERREKDEFHFLSGVFEGQTTGTPLCIVIENKAQNSEVYKENYGKARPGHADYSAFCKYHGFEDYRGGGHTSGRITAALTAAAAVIMPVLEAKGIYIGTHMQKCGRYTDRAFYNMHEDIESLNNMPFPVLDEKSAEKMNREIEKAAAEGDSIGGILQTAIDGLPAGLGEPWFDSIEGMLAHGLFSIPAVKGVSFGAGSDFARMKGSEANGSMLLRDGKIINDRNYNGGIEGGISDGMPIIINTVIKPTPSIFREQHTVDFLKNEETVLKLEGSHDACIVYRARAVADSICALVAADLLAMRFGTDYLGKGL